MPTYFVLKLKKSVKEAQSWKYMILVLNIQFLANLKISNHKNKVVFFPIKLNSKQLKYWKDFFVPTVTFYYWSRYSAKYHIIAGAVEAGVQGV